MLLTLCVFGGVTLLATFCESRFCFRENMINITSELRLNSIMARTRSVILSVAAQARVTSLRTCVLLKCSMFYEFQRLAFPLPPMLVKRRWRVWGWLRIRRGHGFDLTPGRMSVTPTLVGLVCSTPSCPRSAAWHRLRCASVQTSSYFAHHLTPYTF